jgi:hypothetical protein
LEKLAHEAIDAIIALVKHAGGDVTAQPEEEDQ